ncbi:MAG TPA: tannase/feruloyl esterase family alpha/beta hydrolase [Vicinamibacterales bacterium]|jgi:feruloyl esterase|nr:tannase/feruloyl esterase family alpha/beta hydrolase [Vicinamibacterales bacterium]
MRIRPPHSSDRATLRTGCFALLLAAATMLAVRPALTAPMGCGELARLKLPDTVVTGAESVAAGAFNAPGEREGGAALRFDRLPAFCRVAAAIRPSSDSDIRIEVWLPASGGNDTFEAVGNGAWGGAINYAAMSAALARGSATASTDTGHVGAGATFALGHPEKVIDYAYRSEHEMTAKAKAIAEAFYGRAPRLSYFNGCSTGGRQALVEARRFPADFDGIIAGAGANPKTHLDAWRIWIGQAMFAERASVIPPGKFPMIHQAVLAACDGLDGLMDGLIDDPTRCHFDPQILECAGPDGPGCLTPPQVRAAKTIMSPARNRETAAEIFPGFEAGNELGWTRMLAGTEPYGTAQDQFKYITFRDPNWDWRTFDLERDVAIADRVSDGTLAAVDPDLSQFAARGGKLLMYHGWSDPNVAPRASVNYYTSTRAQTKGAPDADWVRLFMVPGMGHCNGGEGPNTFDMMAALERWVSSGEPPERVVASHATLGQVDRTRPLCPYPQVARYAGAGSTDDAANFVCRMP